MRILELKKSHLPKIAVLLTGLAAGVLAVTMSPQAAHAFPSKATNCAGCHTGGTSTATTALPSTTTLAAGATYTVAITLAANPSGGKSGYAIVPTAPDTQKTNAGNTASLTSYTATMTAPAAGGTYKYTVYTNMGSQATGLTGSAVYSITVTGTATTPPATTPGTTPTATTAPATTPPPTTPPTNVPPVVQGIHGNYSLSTDKCGICHRVHTAKAPSLLAKGSQTNPGSQSALCLSCHDGTGASAQYGLESPANVPAQREYYSHDAVNATPSTQHTLSQRNEFGGVSNRHSECADCHNPHKATASVVRDTTQNTDGWSASGRLTGVSGVSVANGAAGSAPTYTFLNGYDDPTANPLTDKPVTREYQLCFKCHSGFTTLTSNTGLKPSQYALDKAVEFNPANPSFHPVEAAGKNTTPAMAASLAGASAYKLWNFKVDQTVRCLNCHTSSETPGTTPLPQPEAALAPHTSANRGILIRNYKDRVLKTGTEAYSDMDFALCYVCHGSAPFAPDASSNPVAVAQTNFQLHSKHVTGLTDNGSTTGTDIDTPGDGAGNAICAECHFRLHSTTNKVPQGGDGTRLVNFAPNVQGLKAVGTPSWTRGTLTGGSCTLTCHGVDHTGYGY